jgi:hypothetical protein
MIEIRIPPAGDPFYAGGVRAGSTRHHRCDDDFLGLLEEDFGVARFALSLAFLGVPAEPKKAAIAVTEWAARRDEPERALLAWARKNRRRAFVLDVAGDDA